MVEKFDYIYVSAVFLLFRGSMVTIWFNIISDANPGLFLGSVFLKPSQFQSSTTCTIFFLCFWSIYFISLMSLKNQLTFIMHSYFKRQMYTINQNFQCHLSIYKEFVEINSKWYNSIWALIWLLDQVFGPESCSFLQRPMLHKLRRIKKKDWRENIFSLSEKCCV